MGEEYEPLLLPAVEVRVVNSIGTAEEVFPRLLVEMVRAGCVALDCEWGESPHEGAALLQLATRGLVVLVDLLELPNVSMINEELENVCDIAFASRHCMLLGFDSEANDFLALRAAWRKRGMTFPPTVARYVDIRAACARANGWQRSRDRRRVA